MRIWPSGRSFASGKKARNLPLLATVYMIMRLSNVGNLDEQISDLTAAAEVQSTELAAQAANTAHHIHQLVDWAYSRDLGRPEVERMLTGALLTLREQALTAARKELHIERQRILRLQAKQLAALATEANLLADVFV
jgi:hypothetical protein